MTGGYSKQDIRRRVTGLLLAGLAGLFFSVFLLEQRLSERHRSDLTATLSALLSTSHQALRQWQQEIRLQARLLAKNPTLIDSARQLLALPLKSDEQHRSRPLRALHHERLPLSLGDRYRQFSIIDPDGNIRASLPDDQPSTASPLNLPPALLQRILSGETAVMKPVLDAPPAAEGQPGLRQLVATPIRDEQAKVIAILTLTVSPDSAFTDVFNQSRFGSSGESYAFDRDGYLLSSGRFTTAASPPGQSDKRQRLSGSNAPAEAGSHGFYRARQQNQLPQEASQTDDYRNYRGTPVIGNWLWDPQLSFGIATELDKAEAFRQQDLSILSVRMMALLAAALMLVTAYPHLRSRHPSREELLQNSFEQATIGIAHLDLSGNWIRLNRRFCEILGGNEQKLRRTPFNLTDREPEDVTEDPTEQNRRQIATLLDGTQTALSIERQLGVCEGQVIWIGISVTLVRNQRGAPQGLMVVLEDISVRKQTLEELIKSQQYMAETERIAEIGYWILEFPQRRLGWSDQTNRIFNLNLSESESGLAPLLERIHPDDVTRVKTELNAVLADDISRAIRFRVISGDRERQVHSEVRITRDSDGKPVTLLGTVQDITGRNRDDERLRQAARVFESASEGIVIASTQPAIVAVNPAFTRITGYSEQEVLGKNPNILSSGRQDALFYRELWESLLRTGRWQGELWNRRKNGELYPEWLTISAVQDGQGQISHYVATFSDISKLKESEDKLAFLAHHDPLTHLPNRIMLDRYLQRSLQKSVQRGIAVAVLFLDLDEFKYINDTWGHPCGDRVLQLVAQRLLHCIGSSAKLTRHGGDEFVLVVEAASPPELEQLAGKLLQTLETPFATDNREFHISGSIGISLYPQHGSDADTLIKNADAAMYEAKRQGRNRFSYYQQELTSQTLSEMEMLSNLRRALELGEFEVHYQPQVSFSTGKISGVEALLRWNHHKQGLIPPDRFIPLAEKSGLIIPIGNWVLEQSCQQLKQWQSISDIRFPISVNLSVVQFRARNLVDTVTAVLRRCQLQAEYLELELTESTLIDNPEDALEQLKRLTAMGVSVALDDFGTGYSSLSYLGRFPIDRVKIDREFVRRLITDTDNTLITRSIISMSHYLHCQVVAEGVETATQQAWLLDQGCDHMQGFLFSKPVTAAELSSMLLEQRALLLPSSGQSSEPVHTLLILDDETAVLHALRRSLRKEGYRILTADDPFEAMELFASNRIGVVITDQRMPQMTGTEFLVRISRLYPETVRIVLSGHADIEAITGAVNEGDIYRYLLKPWDDEKLRQHIREAFRYYENHSQQQLFNESIRNLIEEYEDQYSSFSQSGIGLLDEQHQGLIDLCQQLGQTISARADREKIHQLIGRMLQLSASNFRLEEELMVQHSYAEFQQHLLEHQMFISQLQRLQAENDNLDGNHALFLVLFIGMWIRHHEKGADHRFVEFLRDNRIQQLPQSWNHCHQHEDKPQQQQDSSGARPLP